MFITLEQLKKSLSKSLAAVIKEVNNVKADVDNELTPHIENKDNPHEVTLSQLGVTSTVEELNTMPNNINTLDSVICNLAKPYINSEFKTQLTDSDDAVIRNIELRGKTTQEQGSEVTIENNLLDIDSNYMYSGTSTWDIEQVHSGGTLEVSCGEVASSYGVVMTFWYDDYQVGNAIDLTSNSTQTVYLPPSSGINKIKINDAQPTSSPYEINNLKVIDINNRYVTEYKPLGIDNPQEMKSTNKLDITVCGKNLFNPNNMTKGFLPQNGEYPMNNATFSNASYQLIKLKADDVVTISVIGEDGRSEGRLRVIDNETNKVVNSVSNNVEGYCTSTNNFGSGFVNGTITALKDFTLGILSLYDDVGEVYNLQIEYGTTATEYEPYQEQVISYDLPFKMSSSLDNIYYDYIDLNKGKLIQVLNEVVFDGSNDEVWGVQTTNNANVLASYIPFPDGKTVNKKRYTLCSHFITDTSGSANIDKVNVCSSNGNGSNFLVDIDKNVAGTLDELKTFFANNPITVLYELETPIEHDLPSDLVNQLRALYTYNDTTNVISNVPIQFDYKLNLEAWNNLSNEERLEVKNTDIEALTKEIDELRNQVITLKQQQEEILAKLQQETV